MQRVLDGIERAGNKVPHPALLFLGLCAAIIVLSAVLAALDVKVTYDVAEPPPVPVEETYNGGTVEPSYLTPSEPVESEAYEVHQETTAVESLLSRDGIAFIFTSSVSNFNNFGVVAVILVAMIGVGVAEVSGLIGALIRKLVHVSPESTVTFIIVLMGILSSVATDAGYLVLIPLGAVAFKSIGRNPLAGIAAAFAGVSAAFGVNILITPMDGVVTEITNESIALAGSDQTIGLTANLFFGVASTIFLAFVITFVTQRFVMPSLGAWEPEPADPSDPVTPEDEPEVDADAEAKGLRFALWGLLGTIAFLVRFVIWIVILGALLAIYLRLKSPD